MSHESGFELESTMSVMSDEAADILLQLHDVGVKARWAISAKEIHYMNDNKPIASGSGGDIYKVKWRGLDCAAKTLNKYDVKNRKVIRDLGKEIEIMSTLRHPHLILFLGACFEVFPPVLLMEYAPKGTLETYLEKNPHLKLKTKLRFARELALGLNFLHKCVPPVIHRDFKPSNVLLDQDETLKITDFGLSKFQKAKNIKLNDNYSEAVETTSYRYMAPEVYRHEVYDEKVDVYSYALVVYQILSGIQPFIHKDPIEAVDKATKEGLRPDIEEVNPKFTRHLVTQCWAESPDNRPDFEKILQEINELEAKHKRISCVIS